MKPVNLYSLSRIHDENAFNIVNRHHSQTSDKDKIKFHEIESLRMFVDALIKENISVVELDGFFFGFIIPQIGKEFDVLKFNDKACLNIELKSTDVPREKILDQLLKNRHYLKHLGKRQSLFTIITDSMTCYKLSVDEELTSVEFTEVVSVIQKFTGDYLSHIDDMFNASHYLVSPLNTPEKFIQGEYFLTQNQEQIKRALLSGIDKATSDEYYHLTGKPGTGKTLLLYDIAKTLSKSGKTIIIHCGKLSSGQITIKEQLENLDIVSAKEMKNEDFSLEEYSFILVDETHRIYTEQFNSICESVDNSEQICVFSSDPEQILSNVEKRRDIVGKIKKLSLRGEFTLSEKIRTNKELNSFIINMKDLNNKAKQRMDYSNIHLNYANTTSEAQNILSYYRANGYKFINYSKSNYAHSPYSVYTEDYDTHHVIGQEFDKVVMLLDDSFYYDENGILQGIPHPNPDYLYPNLFYQGVTRVRENLALIVIDAPDLFQKIISIVESNN